jgi:hypothetical protein
LIISGIYEVYAGNKHFHYGKQPELFLGTDTVSISKTKIPHRILKNMLSSTPERH